MRVRVRHLLGIVRLNCAEHPCARLRYLREHIVLVLCVALHRVHEIGDQIRPTLQLHLDLSLRSVGLLIQLLNAIVSAPRAREKQGNCEPHSFHREPRVSGS